jgi:hypothetical protein
VELAYHNTIQIIWVSGYTRIEDNKIANQLPRTGSEHPFTEPETSDISAGAAKKTVTKWMNTKPQKCWKFTTGLKYTKGLLQGHCQKLAKY